jgi:hypothetical protein
MRAKNQSFIIRIWMERNTFEGYAKNILELRLVEEKNISFLQICQLKIIILS